MIAGFANVAGDDLECEIALHCFEQHRKFCEEFLDERRPGERVTGLVKKKIAILWSLDTSLREAQATALHERQTLGMNDPPRDLSQEDLREASEASD